MGLQIRTKTIFHCNRDVATDNITCPCQGQLIFEGLVLRATVTKTLSKLLLACRSKRSLMGLRKSSFARFDFVRLLNIGYCCGYTWNLKPKRWITPRVLRDESSNCIVYQRWKNTIWSNHACRYRLYSKETWLENVSTNVKKKKTATTKKLSVSARSSDHTMISPAATYNCNLRYACLVLSCFFC